MRLSTYNIPRVISCVNFTDKYIALPRGCEDAVIEILDRNDVTYRIDDQTEYGANISVQFKGELCAEQALAIKSLMAYDNGVLDGTTAFGKTVVAIGLIAERKVNTLILVLIIVFQLIFCFVFGRFTTENLWDRLRRKFTCFYGNKREYRRNKIIMFAIMIIMNYICVLSDAFLL